MNEKKINKTVEKAIKLLDKEKLSIEELIVAIGNLAIVAGSNIAGLEGQVIDPDILNKEYYSNPTIDVALMLQGYFIIALADDYKKKPELSDLKNKIIGETEDEQ